jgi:hypothetical protein
VIAAAKKTKTKSLNRFIWGVLHPNRLLPAHKETSKYRDPLAEMWRRQMIETFFRQSDLLAFGVYF